MSEPVEAVGLASPSLRTHFAAVGLRPLTAAHILRIVAVPLHSDKALETCFRSPLFWQRAGVIWPQVCSRSSSCSSGLIVQANWTAHILGMVDFFTAFGTVIRLTAANPGVMHAITGLPMALIAFFGVGVLATIHVIAYDLLLRNRGLQHEAEPWLSHAQVL